MLLLQSLEVHLQLPPPTQSRLELKAPERRSSVKVFVADVSKQKDTMYHLVVEVAVFVVGLLELSLQGLTGPLCVLQGSTSLLPLADQQGAASLHGCLLLPALIMTPYLLLQLSLQLLGHGAVTM